MGIAVEAGGLGGLFWLSSQTTEKSGSSTGPDIFELSHLLEVKPQVRRWVILVWLCQFSWYLLNPVGRNYSSSIIYPRHYCWASSFMTEMLVAVADLSEVLHGVN